MYWIYKIEYHINVYKSHEVYTSKDIINHREKKLDTTRLLPYVVYVFNYLVSENGFNVGRITTGGVKRSSKSLM